MRVNLRLALFEFEIDELGTVKHLTLKFCGEIQVQDGHCLQIEIRVHWEGVN